MTCLNFVYRNSWVAHLSLSSLQFCLSSCSDDGRVEHLSISGCWEICLDSTFERFIWPWRYLASRNKKLCLMKSYCPSKCNKFNNPINISHVGVVHGPTTPVIFNQTLPISCSTFELAAAGLFNIPMSLIFCFTFFLNFQISFRHCWALPRGFHIPRLLS